MPELAHLKPQDGQRFSNVMFDVGPATNDQSPSVKSVGITGQITGSRADVIIADDVEVPKNSATPDQRIKLGELVKEFDAVLKPGGRVMYLGTPQTEFSLYNELEKRGYQTRIWPARYPDQKRLDLYGKRVAPFILDQMALGALEGKTVDPKRFSDLDLLEREASYGRSGFALQFMLDTSLSDAERYPLRLSDLCVMSVNPELGPSKVVWGKGPDLTVDLPVLGMNGDRYYRPFDIQKPWAEYQGAVLSIDPSGKGKDETGFAVVKFLNGQLFLTASGGFQDGYGDATMEGLAKVAKAHKVKEVIIEDNFGNGMFTRLFSPWLTKVGYPCTVKDVRSSGQKEARIIDTLEPVMNQHKLIVDEDVIRGDFDPDKDLNKSLFYQLTRLTRDRGALAHDDRLEALSQAVAYWVEQMGVDVDKARLAVEEALLDRDLKDFFKHVIGEGNQAPEITWCSRP